MNANAQFSYVFKSIQVISPNIDERYLFLHRPFALEFLINHCSDRSILSSQQAYPQIFIIQSNFVIFHLFIKSNIPISDVIDCAAPFSKSIFIQKETHFVVPYITLIFRTIKLYSVKTLLGLRNQIFNSNWQIYLDKPVES